MDILSLDSSSERSSQNRFSSGVVFLNFPSAFDFVWHNGPHLHLVRLGVYGPMVHLIFSSVPQDSLLGSDLFNIYCSDLSSEPGTPLTVYVGDTI